MSSQLFPVIMETMTRYTISGVNLEMPKNVQIKGTKDGIVISLSDKADITQLKQELLQLLVEQKKGPYSGGELEVQVMLGDRLFSEEEEADFAGIIRDNSQMKIKAFYSNVMTKEAAKKWKEAEQIYSMATIIRSGQVLHVPGDFLLIGDINPGGQIRADGNIFVLGQIKGIVHAGFSGAVDAVVAGKFLYPAQVRIAHKFYSFDDEAYKEIGDTDLLAAFIDETKNIEIDGIHTLRKIRPHIANFQGGR